MFYLVNRKIKPPAALVNPRHAQPVCRDKNGVSRGLMAETYRQSFKRHHFQISPIENHTLQKARPELPRTSRATFNQFFCPPTKRNLLLQVENYGNRVTYSGGLPALLPRLPPRASRSSKGSTLPITFTFVTLPSFSTTNEIRTRP